MKLLTVVSASMLFLSSLPALAQSSVAAPEFAMKASVGNTFEVEESKLALKQASSSKVKGFARMMIGDHTKAEKILQDAAKSAGAPVDMTLDPPHQAMVDTLKGKSGANFDKAYLADQVQAHTETAMLLGDYQQVGDNPKLKEWAKKTLPTVNAHLKKVQSLAAM